MIFPAPGEAQQASNDAAAFARDIHDPADLPASVSPYVELGATGLRQFSGYLYEELLPELQGPRGRVIIREMTDGDAVIGAVLFAIEMMVRQVDWGVEAASRSNEDQKNADFLSGVLFDDQSLSWQEVLAEIISFLPWGWSYFEIVWKLRHGQEPAAERDEATGQEVAPAKSRFNDGKIGLRKLAIRSQESLLHWTIDESGSTRAMVQMPPPTYRHRTIPIEKALLFRTTNRKGNPEGRSLLRNVYEAWYFKRALQRGEAIGTVRDLTGLPIAWAPVDVVTATPGTVQAGIREEFKRILRNVHRDEQEGLLMPLEYDPVTHQKLYDFTLLTTGGSRQHDTDKIIQRYDQRIATSLLADFLLLGSKGGGSLALARTKTNFFAVAMMTVLDSICDVLNRHFTPRLFELNGIKTDKLPVVTHSRINETPIEDVAAFITSLAGAGMPLFPSLDGELENWLLGLIDAPTEQNANSAQGRASTFEAKAKLAAALKGPAPEPPGGPQTSVAPNAGQGAAASPDAAQRAPGAPQGQDAEPAPARGRANAQAAAAAKAAAEGV